MQSTTEIGRQNELMIGHIMVYVVAGVLTILMVQYMRNVTTLEDVWSRPVASVVIPWHLASWKTVANGMQDFSGSPHAITPEWGIAVALIGMIMLGVLLPTLLVWALRTRSREGLPVDSARVRDTRDAFVHITFTLSVVLAMGIGGSTIVEKRSFEKLKHSQAIQTAKDEMINDLNLIAMRVREYSIMPRRIGGGGGSYAGFALTPELARTAQAAYTIKVEKRLAIVEAVSIDYPASTITVHVDRFGKLTNWMYGGDFQ